MACEKDITSRAGRRPIGGVSNLPPERSRQSTDMLVRSRRNHRVEWRGVATADEDSDNPRKAFVRVQSTVDAYTLTALCMVQAANSILFNKNTLAAKLGGGILTPATLASPELFRLLDRAGLKIEAKII